MKPAQSKELQLRAMREARFTQHRLSKQKPVKAKPESAAEIAAHIHEQYGATVPIAVGVVPADPTPAPKRRKAKRRNKAAKRQRPAK